VARSRSKQPPQSPPSQGSVGSMVADARTRVDGRDSCRIGVLSPFKTVVRRCCCRVVQATVRFASRSETTKRTAAEPRHDPESVTKIAAPLLADPPSCTGPSGPLDECGQKPAEGAGSTAPNSACRQVGPALGLIIDKNGLLTEEAARRSNPLENRERLLRRAARGSRINGWKRLPLTRLWRAHVSRPCPSRFKAVNLDSCQARIYCRECRRRP